MARTLLHCDSSRGHSDTAAELVLSGASRTAENGDGKTPAELTGTPELRTLFAPAVKSAI